MGVAVAVSKARTPVPEPAILGRDKYDALILRRGSQAAKRAANLIADAIDARVLAPAGIGGDRDDWEALNHDVYATAAQARVVVVQQRHSWTNKYGIQHRKRYYLLWREGGKVVGRPLSPGSVRGIIAHDADPAAVIRRYGHLLPAALAEAVRRQDRVWTRDGEPEE